MDQSHVVALIPARGGSKRLPGKNIKPLLGKPLIGYAIAAAKACPEISRVIVSTDDEQIAATAKGLGAEVPFMRPAELATDAATSLDVVIHAIAWLEASGQPVDILILIQGTSPLIFPSDLSAGIKQLQEKNLHSLVSMSPITDRPEWMYSLDNGVPKPFLEKRSHEVRTQDMAPLYRINGSFWITRRDTIIKRHRLVDDASLGAVIIPRERSIDIDELSDFVIAEGLLRHYQSTQ